MENLYKWRVVTQSSDSQPKVRMPFDMREVIKQKAFENGRTFNNEVLVRLARTLYEEDVININSKGECK